MLAVSAALATAQSTVITIEHQALRGDVKRFGINLSGQTFYDSGQMLRNLTFRNPGFEGETWQSLLRCKQVSGTARSQTCVDGDEYAVWPADFLAGARLDIVSGAMAGASGSVTASTAAGSGRGPALTVSGLPNLLAAGDFLRVRLAKPGGAEAGWWTSLNGGAKLATEFKDLAPGTAGKQALRIEAAGVGQSAAVNSYFDSLTGHSFVQMHGAYTVQFKAKALTPGAKIEVRLQRLAGAHQPAAYLDKSVTLNEGWQMYSLPLQIQEHGEIGTVALSFSVASASVLLDDVALTAAAGAGNTTAFRDEVVAALRVLRPGILRYMDNGTGYGSSLDNLLTPPFGRERAGSSTQETVREDVPVGLHEFLTLCEATGAEPWFSMPPGLSPAEGAALIEYLAGPVNTPYGAWRARLGHTKPWTEAFAAIHLELGNEQWNSASFAGSTIQDATAFGHRAAAVFAAARASQFYQPAKFDLVIGSWYAVPWWTQQELAAAGATADSVAVAPYLFSRFNEAEDAEHIFGPMLAQPEQIDSRADGLMAQQQSAARGAAHPSRLSVYEVNLGTASGSVSQQAIDAAVPSLGAGLAVADHMLLMLRDLGITQQAFFALPEYVNGFNSGAPHAKRTVPLWGAVIDMGGATNRRRPSFYALEMINAALMQTMMRATISGANPTWQQRLSTNDNVELKDAHALQVFAFGDGLRRSLILLNLSRTQALPVSFAGVDAPAGTVTETRLTSAHITDSNEEADLVKPVTRVHQNVHGGREAWLPPFSLTVLTWSVAK